MAIAPIPPVVLPTPPAPAPAPAGATASAQADGFASTFQRGIQEVSGLEHQADALIQDVATGGPTSIHDVMIATSKSSLAVDLLVQVRDRGLEAYQEIMRLQV